MRLLIVDDNAEKLRKLIVVLTSSGIDREQIDISRTATDARARLKTTSYEIAILDLMLPHRDEDAEQVETSLELLRDISDRDEFQKPAHLVGFTAFSDAAGLAKSEFSKTLWTIVIYDETSNAWEEQFRRVVTYVRSSKQRRQRSSYDVDLCVITAMQIPELSAIHRLAWAWEPSEPMDDTTFVRRGRFRSAGHDYSVVSASAPRMGNVASALLSAKMIEHFRPRFLVMAGICAGVKKKANLGDIVLFSPSWEWASGKVVPDAGEGTYLEPAPHQIPVAEFIRARADELRNDKTFWLEVQRGFPEEQDVLPKLIIAPAASGPSVIAHKDYAESLKAQHRKLTAIDMEAYGMCAAAYSASAPRPTTFAMKSACDFADEEKDDRMHSYAAYTSAKAIQGFFEKNMSAIHTLAGT